MESITSTFSFFQLRRCPSRRLDLYLPKIKRFPKHLDLGQGQFSVTVMSLLLSGEL